MSSGTDSVKLIESTSALLLLVVQRLMSFFILGALLRRLTLLAPRALAHAARARSAKLLLMMHVCNGEGVMVALRLRRSQLQRYNLLLWLSDATWTSGTLPKYYRKRTQPTLLLRLSETRLTGVCKAALMRWVLSPARRVSAIESVWTRSSTWRCSRWHCQLLTWQSE